MITRHGFSISLSDFDISQKTAKKIDELLDEYASTTNRLIREYEKTDKGSDMLENRILQTGGIVSNEASELIRKDVSLQSAAVIMAKTGARGSFVNLTQICGFVGQESLEGERIRRGFTDRTLSLFP